MDLRRSIRGLVRAFSDKTSPQPFDEEAEVKRVDGKTVWVRFPGLDYDTPVEKTINVEVGDTVKIRSSGGRGWITGNNTAPPTDDKAANAAKRLASVAAYTAKKAAENAEELDKTVKRVRETAEEALEKAEMMSITEYCLADANAIPVDGTFEDIQYTNWSEEIPGYVVGKYYWIRTVTIDKYGNRTEGDPMFDLTAQAAAEAEMIASSTNNHFWSDGSGAWVTKVDKEDYLQRPSGYATRYVAEGIMQMYEGKKMFVQSNSAATYYQSDGQTPMAVHGATGSELYANGVRRFVTNANGMALYKDDGRTELVHLYDSGIGFADDVPFMLGNSSSFIKWINIGTDQNPKWKMLVQADEIEMGGEQVLTSSDAITITSTEIKYIGSTSGTTPPSDQSSWSTTIPDVASGGYLWTRTRVTYSDGTVINEYSVARQGEDGHQGTSVSITSESINYVQSASGTTPPTSGWSTSIPSVTAGYYLWTRTIVNYSDGTSTTSYSVARQGEDITSRYVSTISGYTGVTVHDAGDTSNFANVNSNGMYIYKSGSQVAKFGSNSFIKCGDGRIFFGSNKIAVQYSTDGSNWSEKYSLYRDGISVLDDFSIHGYESVLNFSSVGGGGIKIDPTNERMNVTIMTNTTSPSLSINNDHMFKTFAAVGSASSIGKDSGVGTINCTGTVPNGYIPIAVIAIKTNHAQKMCITQFYLTGNGVNVGIRNMGAADSVDVTATILAMVEGIEPLGFTIY